MHLYLSCGRANIHQELRLSQLLLEVAKNGSFLACKLDALHNAIMRQICHCSLWIFFAKLSTPQIWRLVNKQALQAGCQRRQHYCQSCFEERTSWPANFASLGSNVERVETLQQGQQVKVSIGLRNVLHVSKTKHIILIHSSATYNAALSIVNLFPSTLSSLPSSLANFECGNSGCHGGEST